MKLICTLIALGLTLNLAAAQTDTAPTNAATASPPAPAVKKVTPPVSSVAPKSAPNAPETRGPVWETRVTGANAKAQAQSDSISLIFDGDSITDFWRRPDRGLATWTERYAKYHAFDFAISADTTQNLLWRLAHGQARGLHPKLIVLMIGTNDMKFTSTPPEIADGVKRIVTGYQKICPDAVILLQAIFPRASQPTDPYRLKIKATNDLLAKLGDGTKVIYLDFGDKFLTSDGILNSDIMLDYVHPTPKGYQIWADAIQPVIDKYLSAK